MIGQSAHRTNSDDEFRKLIWRERAFWLSGIIVPVLMLITVFIL